MQLPVKVPASVRENLPFSLKMKRPQNEVRKKRGNTEITGDEEEEDQHKVHTVDNSGVILEPKEKQVKNLLQQLQRVSFLFILFIYFRFVCVFYNLSLAKGTKDEEGSAIGEETTIKTGIQRQTQREGGVLNSKEEGEQKDSHHQGKFDEEGQGWRFCNEETKGCAPTLKNKKVKHFYVIGEGKW